MMDYEGQFVHGWEHRRRLRDEARAFLGHSPAIVRRRPTSLPAWAACLGAAALNAWFVLEPSSILPAWFHLLLVAGCCFCAGLSWMVRT